MLIKTTRDASSVQERRLAKKLGGYVIANSGAGKFNKSDIIIKEASLSVEAKTCMKDKASFSIKKEWLEKHKQEAFANRLNNYVLAFNFNCLDNADYYIIDDRLMKFLVEKLKEEN